MFKFSLKIDDETHSLTKEDGIPFDKIGELLQKLYTAIDPKTNTKCTLGQIRGNCYALDFYTEEENYVTNFITVHKNIEGISFNDLQPLQKEYAGALNKILGSKYYIKAYDSSDHEVAKIRDIGVKSGKQLDTYFTLKTIYGIVSKLGANSLDAKKSVRIDGVPYDIKVNDEQDRSLKPYYSTDKLRIKIRQKRSQAKGRVIDAELISFTSIAGNNIIDNLKSEGYIDFELIKETHTIEDIVNKIYG